MEDTYKHKGLRKQLVREIIDKGIKDKKVIEAIGKIPRHFFFDKIFDMHAYEDKAFPIASGQTISQPYTVAFQTQLLEIKPGDKILEIGTGSGYQAAVLCELGADVYTIEYQKELYQKVIRFLPSIGYQPHMYHGDGSKGLTRFAPYDGIIVTAGAPSVPEELVDQLKPGGRLVIPVGDNRMQAMVLIKKINEDEIEKKVFNNFSFVPLLGKKGWHQKSD
ncbi:MAG: protein-L-isoaspartate(D-aspartate) O-methyltransferase [Cyclobacteriaceae bacterium]